MTNHLTEAQERERYDAWQRDEWKNWPLLTAQAGWLAWKAAKADATTSAPNVTGLNLPTPTPCPASSGVQPVAYCATTSAESERLREALKFIKESPWQTEDWIRAFADRTLHQEAQHDAALAARPVTQADAGAVVWPTMPASKGQSSVLFEDGYAEGWAKCLTMCKAALAASAQATQAVEPVAAIVVGTNHLDGRVKWGKPYSCGLPLGTKLYTHPAPTTAQEAEPARKKALEDAIKACENEYLCEPNPNYEDRAYDQGVRDCVNALRAIITNEREATQEGGQAKGVDHG